VAGFWWQFGRRRDRYQLFGYGWLLLAYSPLLTAPITEHALYVMSLGWAICGANLLCEALAWLARKWPRAVQNLRGAFA